MKLEGYLVDAVLLGESDGLSPIGNEYFVPLPSSISEKSFGQGQTTQLGYFAFSWSPGQPEKVLI